MNITDRISEALQKGSTVDVEALTVQALDEGTDAKDILEQGFLSGMNIIGEKFKKFEIFVPEVLVAARAMNAGIAIIKPYLIEAGIENKGVVVIGTVKGDLHDIGKNLVKLMMEGKGLKVIDLGVDVPAENFIDAAIENNAGIIACSALLTTTMNEMKTVVELLSLSAYSGCASVMIGGAPITQSFCDQIGADIYTASAADAADAALSSCCSKQ